MAPQPTPPLARFASTSAAFPLRVSHLPISGSMTLVELIAHLGDHGCQDITDRLDLNSCSAYPVSNGGFSDVYQGKLLDGSQVAIKTLRIQVNTNENAARELYTWSKCRHPNVLGLLGLTEFRNQIGMVSYWMDNGSLHVYLDKHPEADRCRMSTGICDGLIYLHAAKIASVFATLFPPANRCLLQIHGDLKGPNVLISDDETPMLTDFGNAVLQESSLKFTESTTGSGLSPRWAAPELINGSGTHSFAADVYALGMTILETITGKLPYSERSDLGVYAVLLFSEEVPLRPEDSIPSSSKDGDTLWVLLTACWARDRESRPSADQARDIMCNITQEGLKEYQVEAAGSQPGAVSLIEQPALSFGRENVSKTVESLFPTESWASEAATIKSGSSTLSINGPDFLKGAASSIDDGHNPRLSEENRCDGGRGIGANTFIVSPKYLRESAYQK
ncbi:kinase-like protein [Ceratobasidium sp. AG-I]|nr:kinase-like protein [Ceratobasidium sp. AG-I]